MSFEEWSLGINDVFSDQHLSDLLILCLLWCTFKIQLHSFFKVGDRLIYGFSETGNINIQTLGYEVLSLPVDDVLYLFGQATAIDVGVRRGEGLVVFIEAHRDSCKEPATVPDYTRIFL